MLSLGRRRISSEALPRFLSRSAQRGTFRTYSTGPRQSPKTPLYQQTRYVLPATALVLAGSGYVAYENHRPFRHAALAVVRCSRVIAAAVTSAIDYKLTFAKTYASEAKKEEATRECHKRSAERVLKRLLANGGIFIKLGQHIAALIVIPKEWRDTMKPLQDKCNPTSYKDLEEMFLLDEGRSISDVFEGFDPKPIGVASLAQVHVGRLKDSGQEVAVKLQHPDLLEFCDIDLNMVQVALGWIKRWFPEFEFTWLASEMRENIPKELDFRHEARNAQQAEEEFKDIRTSLYIPKIIEAKKRILIMEFIRGGRPDDLQYLADHNIDRNVLSLELARIFAQMVHLNGWFHADPHPGNLLIRPRAPTSKSPYNFDVVLLDHGLYFDLADDWRINYSKFWLSLIAPPSEKTNADRRKYAAIVGNVDEDLYPVFEAAITGRIMLDEAPDGLQQHNKRDGETVEELQKQTEEELEAIRTAVTARDGLIVDVFSVLRNVPRRVLMVLKLNDLTRSLDHALATTHSNIRVFLVTAKYCTLAIWEDERRRLLSSISSTGLLSFLVNYAQAWWRFETKYRPIVLTETWMDVQAELVMFRAWLRGLIMMGGLAGAHQAAAGLA